MDEFYGTDGIHGYGYGQDEDQGQLGAWYVIASTGLFDVKGLTELRPAVQFGSPKFDKLVITLGNGKELKVIANNNSRENYYVQSLQVNGKEWCNFDIFWDEIKKGGTLVFEMGPSPNKSWGLTSSLNNQ